MVSKEDIISTLQQLKAASPKRKFSQSVDLVINLKELDLKKPEEQLDVWVPLTHDRGKPVKIAALVGPELLAQAKATCDTAIAHDDFKTYEGKKKDIKKLAKTHDFFIAQANIMPDVAKYFGRVLGPRGKMPNPKAGCVVPPNANLKALTDKLKKTLHVVAKTQLSAKCSVGKQDMPDDQLAENLMTVYTAVIRALPQEQNNIKSVLLKYSMGPVLRIGASAEEKAAKKKRAPVEPVANEAAPDRGPAGRRQSEVKTNA
jgi:large subunit ribosomal protein L1